MSQSVRLGTFLLGQFYVLKIKKKDTEKIELTLTSQGAQLLVSCFLAFFVRRPTAGSPDTRTACCAAAVALIVTFVDERV